MLISPFAPHLAEEAWQLFDGNGSILHASWPEVDEAALVQDTIHLVIQVNGKVRSHLDVSATSTKEELEALALADETTQKFIGDKTVRKVIVVPGRLVNVAVS